MNDFSEYFERSIKGMVNFFNSNVQDGIKNMQVIFIDSDVIKKENGVAIIPISKGMNKDEYYLQYDKLCKKGVHWVHVGFLEIRNNTIIVVCEKQPKISWTDYSTRTDIVVGGAFELDNYKIAD